MICERNFAVASRSDVGSRRWLQADCPTDGHRQQRHRNPSSFLRHLHSMSLDAVAELADRVCEIAPVNQVVQVASTSSSAGSLLEVMRTEIASLTWKLDELTTSADRQTRTGGRSNRSRDRRFSRSRSRSRGHPFKMVDNRRLCWYHHKFEDKPYHCIMLVTASDCCSTRISSRLFVIDLQTRKPFLVDTGSDLCVYPRRYLNEKRIRVNYDLSAANNSVISTYGYINLQLNLGLRREYIWKFVVADVTKTIIGYDFLSHYNLLVDCLNNRLIDGFTNL